MLRIRIRQFGAYRKYQREDLSFLEEAEGYPRLIQEYGLLKNSLHETWEKPIYCPNKMRILRLSPEILSIISQEKLSERHARALLRLPDEDLRLKVLEQVVEKGLSVRQTEELIERTIDKINKKRKKIFKNSYKRCGFL